MTEATPDAANRARARTTKFRASSAAAGSWPAATAQVRSDDPVADMVAFADAGITTFDCADIYTGVEELIGEFRLRYRDAARRGGADARSRCTPSSCPTSTCCRASPRSYVEGVIDHSLQRLRMERLDLVQFHWWDYAVPRLARSGRPSGSTSCSAPARSTRSAPRISTPTRMLALVESGVPLMSMQVQYSLLDDRAGAGDGRGGGASMASRCSATARSPAASSATAGWALPEPAAGFENRSLIKYKLVIDDFGGWELFQALLKTLRAHRRPPRQRHRHGGQRRHAAAAGGRGGHRRRAQPLASRLEPRDFRASRSPTRITPRSTRCWPRASELDGDVFELERDRNGRHGSIMKYNLNKGAA